MSDTPMHIVKDMGRKLADDVGAAMRRNALLMTDTQANFATAMYGAATAVAWAASPMRNMTSGSDEDCANALWDALRPMVISAMALHAKIDGAA